MGYLPIESYGIIGNLHTVALVGVNGSIDYMCFPRFDSPTVFASLLDDDQGGYFRVAPVKKEPRQKQIYLPETNILLSRFLFEQGVSEVCDFMPIASIEGRDILVREAKTVVGEITYRMVCQPAFDYGRCFHRIENKGNEALFIPEDPDISALRLKTSVPLQVRDGGVISEFTLKNGQSAYFVLEEARPGQEELPSLPEYVEDRRRSTISFWRNWIARSKFQGRWQEIVNRSALVLKLLTYQPSGAIVAAPTFGLPETIGGARNWDYRYTWIRDASFTLYALFRLGYTDEADNFMNWIENRCNELGPHEWLRLMYSIDGQPYLWEKTLDHLKGYKGSTPVRIGNCAFRQNQLDIYGELMDFIFLYDKYGKRISFDLWQILVPFLNRLCDNWNQPDDGIWEVRGISREFLFSRVMCWVAFDRAIRLAQKRSFPAPLEKWRTCRDNIYLDIFNNFWDPDLKTFVQHKGGKSLDASALFMPLARFVAPTDPRWLSTLQSIERNLVTDSLVYRYQGISEDDDGTCLDGICQDEGTFNMCTFLYVECLSRSGQLEKARYVFEKMLGYANHLGLYSEELGPQGNHLGNFPQAFTHIGLISAAYDLNRRLYAAGEIA